MGTTQAQLAGTPIRSMTVDLARATTWAMTMAISADIVTLLGTTAATIRRCRWPELIVPVKCFTGAICCLHIDHHGRRIYRSNSPILYAGMNFGFESDPISLFVRQLNIWSGLPLDS